MLPPNPIPSARASGFKGTDRGTTQRTSKPLLAAPLLRSPKRKVRESTFAAPEPHSLGSRLGLQGQGHGYHSTHQQTAFPPPPLLRSPKRKLRETALLLPDPIPSARASGFKGKDMGTTQRTSKTLRAAAPCFEARSAR